MKRKEFEIQIPHLRSLAMLIGRDFFGNKDDLPPANTFPQPRLFYYNKNVEVDFYVPSAGYAVQVSYDVSDPDTFRREASALVALHRAFGLQRAVIVTRDHEETFECDDLTIEAIPVWKWLLE